MESLHFTGRDVEIKLEFDWIWLSEEKKKNQWSGTKKIKIKSTNMTVKCEYWQSQQSDRRSGWTGNQLTLVSLQINRTVTCELQVIAHVRQSIGCLVLPGTSAAALTAELRRPASLPETGSAAAKLWNLRGLRLRLRRHSTHGGAAAVSLGWLFAHMFHVRSPGREATRAAPHGTVVTPAMRDQSKCGPVIQANGPHDGQHCCSGTELNCSALCFLFCCFQPLLWRSPRSPLAASR